MTTVVVNRNYLIADHRARITVQTQGDTIYFNDNNKAVSVVSPKGTTDVFTKNNVSKICLVDDQHAVYHNGHRLIAFVVTGNALIYNKAFERLRFMNEHNIPMRAMAYFDWDVELDKDDNGSDIVFYFDNGSAFILRNVEDITKRKWNTATFEDDDDYTFVTGSGGESGKNLEFNKIHDPRTLFLTSAYFDEHSTCSYSVLGRREGEFYPYVDEPEEDIRRLVLQTVSSTELGSRVYDRFVKLANEVKADDAKAAEAKPKAEMFPDATYVA
jgi:hypothetical protein